MTQFLRDEGSDSEEVITPLMLDGTYLSRNFATLGPFLTLQPPCGSRKLHQYQGDRSFILTEPLSLGLVSCSWISWGRVLPP